MTDKHTHPSEADAVARIVRDHIRPEVITVTGQKGQPETQILILPEQDGGLTPIGLKPFLDPWRTQPERRAGRATMTDLGSLIAHAKRFKDADSALFAVDNRDAPALIAVLDYHRQGAEGDPRFGQHRCAYEFPLSDEWKAWRDVDKVSMSQIDFALFLEDRIIDVMAPPSWLTRIGRENDDAAQAGPEKAESDGDQRLADLVAKIGGKVCGPAKLMELAKGLRIHDQQVVKEVVNTNSGEVQLKFDSEHRGEDGKPINVPNLFLVAIPVFHNGPSYRIPVRLRYRVLGGKISWSLTMHRPDLAQDHAFKEACEKAQKDTDLPLFFGLPEIPTCRS